MYSKPKDLRLLWLAIAAVSLILAFAMNAEASGKLTLQNNFYNQGKDYRPMIGLGIYEPIFGGGVAFNSWTGYGNQPFDLNPDTQWFTTKNQIDFHMKRLTVSPGFQWSYVWPYNEERNWFYVKLDYKLW